MVYTRNIACIGSYAPSEIKKYKMIIDLKEIPKAHGTDGFQDSFELFARDLLKLIGYNIIEDPSRGADDGKDLIVEEERNGIGGSTKVLWLVSCKHKAHSGKSVTQNEDFDIYDRVKKNKCNGFIGFYSTIAQSTLAKKIYSFDDFETQIFDREKIEQELLASQRGIKLAKRYFPKSIKKWFEKLPNNEYMKWRDNDKIISVDLSDRYWVVMLGALDGMIRSLKPKYEELSRKGLKPDEISEEMTIVLTAPMIIRGIIVEELYKHKVINEDGKKATGFYSLMKRSNEILDKANKKKDGA